MWWLLASALAGDVWMQVESKDDGNDVVLNLPVNGMVADADPVPALLGGKEVDLRAEVAALRGKRAGTTRRYTVTEEDGDRWPVVLTVSEASTEAVDALAVRISAERGFGLTFDMPLDEPVDAEQLKQSADVSVGPRGLDLDLNAENQAQILRGGPRTLMRITGPKGNGIEVSTVKPK
jgi:hypothetical protein